MAGKVNIDGTEYNITKGIVNIDGTTFNITKGLTKVTDATGASDVKEINLVATIVNPLYLFGPQEGVTWDDFKDNYVVSSNETEITGSSNAFSMTSNSSLTFKIPDNWSIYTQLSIEYMSNAACDLELYQDGSQVGSLQLSSSNGDYSTSVWPWSLLIEIFGISLDTSLTIAIVPFNMIAFYNIWLEI